jgi:hypothetical protein
MTHPGVAGSAFNQHGQQESSKQEDNQQRFAPTPVLRSAGVPPAVRRTSRPPLDQNEHDTHEREHSQPERQLHQQHGREKIEGHTTGVSAAHKENRRHTSFDSYMQDVRQAPQIRPWQEVGADHQRNRLTQQRTVKICNLGSQRPVEQIKANWTLVEAKPV